MTVGIMQPYFLPYLGYFSLIRATDKWVVFDTPQFIRHGWIERNRVLNSFGEWQYIKVPLAKFHQKTPIKDVMIRAGEDWRRTLFAQLTCYKRKAPNYNTVIDFLQQALAGQFTSISKLNVHLLAQCCKFAGIEFNYQVFSEMEISLDTSEFHAGSWALAITSSMGADTYINPRSGRELFKKSEFDEKGIGLQLLSRIERSYDQRNSSFQPDLSVLDAMMFLEKDELLSQIDSFQLEEHEEVQ